MAGRRETGDPGALKLAVLGSPIAHSKSPAIHAAAYRELGLEWDYTRVQCEERELAAFLAGLGPEWRGLSLTMPLKEEAHRLAPVLDPIAEQTGVVNTLLHLAGDAGWAGFNTDVGGLAAALVESGIDTRRTVLLGAGATAVSTVLAARSLGAECITVLARREEAARELAARFDLRGLRIADPEAAAACSEATAVISTLPGAAGADLALPEGATAVPLFDVAYDPWPSPLAERWRSAGGEAHAGIGMLVQQALLQVRIFVAGDPGIPLEDEGRVLAAMRSASMGE